jgi:cytochrome c553
MFRAFLSLVIVTGLAGVAIAGNCHQFFRVQKFHHAYVAPVVVAPVGYAVGASIQEDAVAERIAVKVEARLALKAQQQVAPQQHDTSILTAKCARCHGGASPAGELLIDGTADFPPDALAKWMKMAARGQDVPDKMKPVMAALKPDDIAAITDALLGQ